ncbi:hypothetical protein ACF1BQ_012855 [Bradyrhizobium sp. RDT10]
MRRYTGSERCGKAKAAFVDRGVIVSFFVSLQDKEAAIYGAYAADRPTEKGGVSNYVLSLFYRKQLSSGAPIRRAIQIQPREMQAVIE